MWAQAIEQAVQRARVQLRDVGLVIGRRVVRHRSTDRDRSEGAVVRLRAALTRAGGAAGIPDGERNGPRATSRNPAAAAASVAATEMIRARAPDDRRDRARTDGGAVISGVSTASDARKPLCSSVCAAAVVRVARSSQN